MAIESQPSSPKDLFLFLTAVVRRVHGDFARRFPLAGNLFTGLPEFTDYRELGFLIELAIPIAERIAVPGRFRLELRQLEALPEFARTLHVLLLRQGDRRKSLF